MIGCKLRQFKVSNFQWVDFASLLSYFGKCLLARRHPVYLIVSIKTISVLQVFTSTLQLHSHDQLWLLLLVALASMVTSAATAYILIR